MPLIRTTLFVNNFCDLLNYFSNNCNYYNNLIAVFTENAKGNVNLQWMRTMMAKGTVSDKIAAFTVTIQDNPVCNLEALRNLVGMVKVSKKKECIAVIGKIIKAQYYLDYILKNMDFIF